MMIVLMNYVILCLVNSCLVILRKVGPMVAAQLGEDGGVELKGGQRLWGLRAEV